MRMDALPLVTVWRSRPRLRAHRADLPAAFHAVDDDVHHFLEQSLIDDGGRDDMPTRRRSQHQYRAALHRQLLQLNVALETRGLFDKRGRLRVAWLSKLESLMRESARVRPQSWA